MQALHNKRGLKIYKTAPQQEELLSADISELLERLTVCEPGSKQYQSLKQVTLKLADIGSSRQDQSDEQQLLFVQQFKEQNAQILVLKQCCLLSLIKTDNELLEADFLLLKCFTDDSDGLNQLDLNSLLYICNENLYTEVDRIKTIVIYIIYNIFRYIDDLKIGLADVIIQNAVKYNLFKKIVDLCLAQQIQGDTLLTAIEALAALSDCECFLDYCGKLLESDTAREFIKFYDAFVIQLLDDPTERGKMLCFDDVLSWIRREIPEVEDQMDAE